MMLAIYVREGTVISGWTCSMIGDRRVGDLLNKEHVLWCLDDMRATMVRVRQHFARCIRDTEYRDIGVHASHSYLEELANAAAAAAVISIEPCVDLHTPCWLAERKENLAYVQHIVVQAEVKTMADIPDVQSYLSEVGELDAGMDALLSIGDTIRVEKPATETPAGVLQARAIATPIHPGLTIACETSNSKVFLRLQKSLGAQQFIADVDVCGTSPLRVGDVLHRTVSATDGEMWRANVATVSEVLGTDGRD